MTRFRARLRLVGQGPAAAAHARQRLDQAGVGEPDEDLAGEVVVDPDRPCNLLRRGGRVLAAQGQDYVGELVVVEHARGPAAHLLAHRAPGLTLCRMMRIALRPMHWTRMPRILRRVAAARGYRRGIAPTWTPEPRPAELSEFVGRWVAVKDGKVIAAAFNARDLVPQLHAMGEAGRGAVAQFVPLPSDSIMIGVG